MPQQLLENPDVLNEPVDPNDRFAYGWRYVEQHDADGSLRSVKIPLTLEDILHPQEEDFRLNNDPHIEDCTYLRGVFKSQVRDVPGAQVLTYCRVAWDAAGKCGHGPDNAVIFNVRAYQEWGTFNVVEEGTKPALIVEITCPSTRSTDLVDKVKEYAEQGVPHYVIADARFRKGVRAIKLIDYHLNDTTGEYESMPADEHDRVWLPEVDLWLGSEDGLLACYDAAGKRKGNYSEVESEREEAVRAAVEHEQALIKAEAKNSALEARIRELEQQIQRRNGNHLNGST